MAEIVVHPVGPDRLDVVQLLFDGERSTRHCSCMAFCSSSWRFARGWYGGGNRRDFGAMAASSDLPVGVVATLENEPVGWCACGPRARYTAAIQGRSRLLAGRPRDEDSSVWLVACVFVAAASRGTGAAVALLRAAVALAGTEGASAVEAWPLATGVRRPGEEHLGREGVFARLGFRCVERPTVDRALMRLELRDQGSVLVPGAVLG